MDAATPIRPVRIARVIYLEVFSQGTSITLGQLEGVEQVLAVTHGDELLAALEQGLQVDLVMVLVLPADFGEMQLLKTLRARYPALLLVALLYEPDLEHYEADFDGGATTAILARDMNHARMARMVVEARAALEARR